MRISLLLRIIWNSLAVIGLLTVIGVSIGFSILLYRSELTPVNLAQKIARKSLAIVLPEMINAGTAPKVKPEQYPPAGLSPNVSTAPIDQDILYKRQILRVGPNRSLKRPSEAARVAKSGDIIEIDAGLYVGDVALWQTPNLTIRGVGGRAALDSGGAAYGGKAIWVIQGDNYLVDSIEFKNCMVRDRNGAGIRVEGDNLKVRNCLFLSNENGILCGNLKNVHSLKVQYSEFGFNGYGDGQSHGIYVGAIDQFIFQFNYVHHTKSGHHVKSRARSNQIGYNLLTDHEDGNASYAIDLPNGGDSVIIGNVLHQSKYTENSSLIHYGMPSTLTKGVFYVINNTASSSRHTGVFLLNHTGTSGLIVNNLLIGKLQIIDGRTRENHNLVASITCLAPRPFYPYTLKSDCSAVDGGTAIEKIDSLDLVPRYEYVFPLSKQARNVVGKIDIGAYEYKD